MLSLKHLRLYRLSSDNKIDNETLQNRLEVQAFTPCGNQDMQKTGWIPPFGVAGGQLFHSCNHHVLLAYHSEKKQLPNGIPKKIHTERAGKLETDLKRNLKRAEKASLRDEIRDSLQSQAFSYPTDIRVWIDTSTNLIAVGTNSAKKASDVLAFLRKTLGPLQIVPLTMKTLMVQTFTGWVRKDLPLQRFDLGETVVLQDKSTANKLTCRRLSQVRHEICWNLHAGRVATQLKLSWKAGLIDFTLTDDFCLHDIQFSHILLTQHKNLDRQAIAIRFDAGVRLLTRELSALIADLLLALDGLTPEETHPVGSADPLLEDAIHFVLDTARPTISAIQRRFRIGYNRAARILKSMEILGIVSARLPGGGRKIISGAAFPEGGVRSFLVPRARMRRIQ